jgi:hypothetical protein
MPFKSLKIHPNSVCEIKPVRHQAYPDYWHGFFSGSVDQSAVGIIEGGADIYVNLGGMMVTGFIHHCKPEGLSSNPGVTLVFFFQPHVVSKLYVNSVRQPGVCHVHGVFLVE